MRSRLILESFHGLDHQGLCSSKYLSARLNYASVFTIDLHLDLSMNAMEWNRDLRLPVTEINRREAGKKDLAGRERAMVSLPALRSGGTGLVVATQIARYVAPGNPLPGWTSPEQAWAQTQGQLAWYRAMEAAGEMVQITDLVSLDHHIARWMKAQSQTHTDEGQIHPSNEFDANTRVSTEPAGMSAHAREEFPAAQAVSPSHGDSIPLLPVGYILSLEGADSLVNLSYLETAVGYGLRAIGPAHYGPGRYANGTDSTGRMGPEGTDLLRAMDEYQLILDATHLCDDAFWQAMEIFKGPVWASHQNCRSLVPHNRQFDDAQLKVLIERNAIIGAAMDAWMIVPGWKRGESDPVSMQCGLEALINHIDHICQLAGNSRHVCIGSDLDGGFGKEQAPYDMETIADLQKIPSLLQKRGYAPEDIEGIMHGNALRFLRAAWA
jgi:membrane dipeptidase